MIKRIGLFVLAIAFLLNSTQPVLACDEEQNNSYIINILFGDDALRYENNDNVNKILGALYICSEQCNNAGQEKLDLLKRGKIGSIPTLEKINLSNEELYDCAHQSWNYVSSNNKDVQEARKTVLRKTITKTFDFGWFNELFNSKTGKIDSFAALLYYSHILADYLADDPKNTTISAKGYDVPAFSGSPYIELNGNMPNFSAEQKATISNLHNYDDLDQYKRSGSGIICISKELIELRAGTDSNVSKYYPTGWQNGNVKYPDVMKTELYNRCHLIAHSLGGADSLYNLVTGTRYMNEAMEKNFESKIKKYIEETGNHVLYRATPVYVGNNKIASGIQLEGYSIEDKGEKFCFNVYLYNVQPGVTINYANGKTEQSDQTVLNKMVPFATSNPSDTNPDLMYLIIQQLKILFADQAKTSNYNSLINELTDIANQARSAKGTTDLDVYINQYKSKHDFMSVLTNYVPKLLKKEEFFLSAFK